MTDDLPIIDAHHHLWDLEQNYYPWLSDQVAPAAWGTYDDLLQTYGITEFLADIAGQGVVKSVHLDVGWDPRDPVGETRWLQGIADRHGYPHGIVGYADLAADDVESVLDGHQEHANFRGVRQSMNYHEDPAKTYLTEPEVSRRPQWRRGFRALARRGLSFDLQLYHPQMREFRELADTFPDVQILLNHTGMQVDGPEHFDAWRTAIGHLAGADNVACKISGLGMGDHRWTVASIRPYVETAIEAFGTDRCLFASNFPVDKLFSTYAELWDAYRAITADWSITERRKLFHDNAQRFYRL